MSKTFKIVDGDVVLNEAVGRPYELEDTPKLTQDVRETLDSDVQDDGTGAGLDDLIGVTEGALSLRAEMSQNLEHAFAALKAVQERVQRFDRTRKERISQVVSVVVLPLKNPGSAQVDQTQFAYRVDVISAEVGGEPISTTGVLVRSS